MNSNHIKILRQMLLAERGVLPPGAPNALAARIIADLGFKAVYLTGAGLTNMHLGLPDLSGFPLGIRHQTFAALPASPQAGAREY